MMPLKELSGASARDAAGMMDTPGECECERERECAPARGRSAGGEIADRGQLAGRRLRPESWLFAPNSSLTGLARGCARNVARHAGACGDFEDVLPAAAASSTSRFC